jgi:hypothetical protein
MHRFAEYLPKPIAASGASTGSAPRAAWAGVRDDIEHPSEESSIAAAGRVHGGRSVTRDGRPTLLTPRDLGNVEVRAELHPDPFRLLRRVRVEIGSRRPLSHRTNALDGS